MASQGHQTNTLKMVIAFAKCLGPNCTFYDLHRPDQIIPFLDTKIKSESEDPDRRWITTWNDYLIHIKLFLRWLYNCASKNNSESSQRAPESNWETPPAARIKKKRTKRQSPYSETENWDREELFTIIKYEPEIRKAANHDLCDYIANYGQCADTWNATSLVTHTIHGYNMHSRRTV